MLTQVRFQKRTCGTQVFYSGSRSLAPGLLVVNNQLQTPHTCERDSLGFPRIQSGALQQTLHQILLLDGQVCHLQPAVFHGDLKLLHTHGMNSSAGIDRFRLHDRPYQDLTIECLQDPKMLEFREDDQRRGVCNNHSISSSTADYQITYVNSYITCFQANLRRSRHSQEECLAA